MPRVVLAVGIAAYPRCGAGVAWAYVNWALGFRQAGWDVWLVERLRHDKAATTPELRRADMLASMHWWRDTLGRYDLLAQSSLFTADGAVLAGHEIATLTHDDALPSSASITDRTAQDRAARDELLAFADGVDLMLNISGHFMEPDVLAAPRHRTYLDLDPFFTQVWQEVYGVNMNLDAHDSFASVGTRIGAPDYTGPHLDREWLPTLPPVSLEHWSPTPADDAATQDPASALTTVTHWHGYNPVEWQGQWYGNKSQELFPLAELPRRVHRPMEIAGDAATGDENIARMIAGGWRLGSASEVCASLDTYASYLRASAGEFSVAKHGYVLSRCGWFSDRTVCYLALGKPCVIQETGWSQWPGLDEGAGLLAFCDETTAADAVNQITEDVASHSAAARELAEANFDAETVVGNLVSKLPL